jgi:DNA-binding transcriptional MerR regulator
MELHCEALGLALKDVGEAVDSHTAALRQLTGQQLDDHQVLSEQQQQVIAQREMIDALQRRCENNEAAIDELKASLQRLRGLVRHVEGYGLR